jgi:hypothetical protein
MTATMGGSWTRGCRVGAMIVNMRGGRWALIGLLLGALGAGIVGLAGQRRD